MDITHIQTAHTAAGGGSSVNVTIANTVGGNFLVAFAAWGIGGGDVELTSVTDSGGAGSDTFVAVRASQLYVANLGRLRAYYAKNIGSGRTTVTFNWSGNTTNFANCFVSEYSGGDLVNLLDGSNSAAGISTTIDGGAVTTTKANELIWGGSDNQSGGTTSAGTGFTIRDNITNATVVEDKVVNATGTYNATATSSVSGFWGAMTATFISASQPAAAGIKIRRTLSSVGTRIGSRQIHNWTKGYHRDKSGLWLR